MRLLPLFILVLAAAAPASESPTTAYPLWDGREPVAAYARRVNLPPAQFLDLDNGVKLELVLIPAGKFIMGTPEPEKPKETVLVGQIILSAAGTLAFGLLFVVLFRAVRKRKRPQFSLRFLLAVVFALSITLFGGVRWHKTEHAWREYGAAKARYDAAYRDEKPAHPVTLTQPFYMGKYAITQEQYQAVTGATPSHFNSKDNPVEQVSWDDAQAFCKKLADQTKQAVRLPTEAEWEFACRAGTTTTNHSGDAESDLARVAWYYANSNAHTHPVGRKEANAFGLYDMHGNVWQWCQDWYGADYYGKSESVNPQGPAQGHYCVFRGGRWNDVPAVCRSARRGHDVHGYRNAVGGFRVVVASVSSRTH